MGRPNASMKASCSRLTLYRWNLAHSQGEVLLQPGKVLLRVSRNADGGVQVFGTHIAGDGLELLRRPQFGEDLTRKP